MRKKETKNLSGCDEKNAATLAASSLAQYFYEKKWKIVSFFPNAVEAGAEKKKILKLSKSSKKSKKADI